MTDGYDQAALDAASREVHMMLLREGSSWGTKACEEMGRVFMTAYRKALPSATGAQCTSMEDCTSRDACGIAGRCLAAAPAPAQGEPVANGNPLLWNVHCMFQQAERGAEWESQWRDLLAAIEQHLQRVDYPNAAPTAPVVEAGAKWQPIETAPKDGTIILAWCVHTNAKYAANPVKEGWVAPVVARWIDHHGGGWTWNGHAGEFTHWMPLPDAPCMKPSEGGK